MGDLLAIALRAVEDPSCAAILGDAIQEAGWFDARVMQVIYPMSPCPRNGFRTASAKRHRKESRVVFDAGFPVYFAGFIVAPTPSFARAVAAVLLFGEWRKRPWPLVDRIKRAEKDRDAERRALALAEWRRTALQPLARRPRQIRGASASAVFIDEVSSFGTNTITLTPGPSSPRQGVSPEKGNGT